MPEHIRLSSGGSLRSNSRASNLRLLETTLIFVAGVRLLAQTS